MRVRVFSCVFGCVCAYVRECVCVRTCVRVHVSMCVNACMCHVCVYVCLPVFEYMYVTYMYLNKHQHTLKRKLIHTHPQSTDGVARRHT